MITRWYKDDSGQALSEYGLIIALIAVVAIAIVAIFGRQIRDAFTGASNRLPAPAP
ncbi:Flp family type IVb pilin [Candidatus Uhrbacteria bacterium]|nr:Flp family type IVb pilin [Candidatus Uhrbacteria bacterium]